MIAEIRGHGRKWRVFYENETGMNYPVPVYDRDGKFKTVLWVNGYTPIKWEDPQTGGKFVPAHFEPTTKAEAEALARYLGAETVVVRPIKTRKPAQAELPLAA